MNLISFIIYCVVVTFTPGPSNIVILSSARHFGAGRTMNYVWGATLAFGLLLASSAGLSHWLSESLPYILYGMRIVGSIYMLYLAYLIYKMGNVEGDTGTRPGFLTGFVMQFVNPKVILFTFTVLPGYVLPHYDSVIALSLFVLLVTVIGFMAYTSWAVFGALLRRMLNRHLKLLNVVMAAFLVYSAIMVSGLI